MVLRPLEFTDCLHDSPFFRENLQAHEKELENTSEAIKGLLRECRHLLGAMKGDYTTNALELLHFACRRRSKQIVLLGFSRILLYQLRGNFSFTREC